MMSEFLAGYAWQTALVYLLSVVLMVKIGKALAFKVPALERMRQWNKDEDRKKRALPKYPPVMKSNARVGLFVSLLLVLVVAPSVLTLEALPWWRYLVDILAVLLVYDFIYYLTHRFLFHGEILKKVHGLHHQARDISHIDSLYVHPLETFIGLMIYVVSITSVSLAFGGLHAVSAAAAYVIWSQINVIVHTKFNLDYFPWKTIDWMTTRHGHHHTGMRSGCNFSSIFLVFDWMFGTLK